ncbi:aminopeptidase [Alkalibaculum sp. M08DMB]|uniref:Aminopeptidase n=1 Tax=Alkalibaculum sporogenes TaxID=2655001 RepID=A0A6A7K7U2_9FIRM|nr:aminopeptidase [Alkalibaculum sporogenes]MPW25422.1 aminopeptidase [Alkalibaculum sporogenes]
MSDIRLKKYAHTLINYSLEVKKDNLVVIQGYDLSYPLIEECYREVVKLGAHPYVILKHDLNEILFKEGNENQLSYISPISEEIASKADRLLNIGGGNNTKYMSNIDPKKISAYNKARGNISKIQMDRADKGKMKWTICMYPTQSSAQEAGMSIREYEDFIFEACLINDEDPVVSWKKVRDSQQNIVDYLNKKNHLRIVADGTDIEMKIKNRIWINSDGHNNFPSGEVFSAPVEDSVNGTIRFSFPGIYSGQEIEDIRLTFTDGKVVEAKATKGQKLLEALLATDEGASRVGEVAIGTNYNITQFTKNMLFDEKIGGTVHLALGKSYALCGGKNKSAIHWDMLCDMRDGGEIYADDELFYKDGKSIIND